MVGDPTYYFYVHNDGIEHNKIRDIFCNSVALIQDVLSGLLRPRNLAEVEFYNQ